MNKGLEELLGEQFNSNLIAFTQVNAKELKDVFADLKEVFRKTNHSKLFTIAKRDKFIVISARTTIEYRVELPILTTSIEEDFETAIQFVDISNVLGGKGESTIRIIHGYLSLETSLSDIELESSISKPLVLEKEVGVEVFEKTKLLSGIDKVLATSNISRAYSKVGTPVFFIDDIIKINYPTIHFEFESSGLNTVMSMEDVGIVRHFVSKNACKITQEENYVIIASEHKSIKLANNKVELKKIDTSNMSKLADMKTIGIKDKIEKLKAAVGSIDCYVSILDDGMTLTTDRGNIRTKIKVGKLESNIILTTFTVPIDFLICIFKVVGKSYTLYKKGDVLCLSGQSTIQMSARY